MRVGKRQAPITRIHNLNDTHFIIYAGHCTNIAQSKEYSLDNTVEPPNKGHFGDNINSADLVFVVRFSFPGGSKCLVGYIFGL